MMFGFFGTMTIASLCFVSTYAVAQSTDTKSTKLRISQNSAYENHLAVGDGSVKDCKLSLIEIEQYDGASVGNRYLCAHLVDFNSELSFAKLAALAEKNKITLGYEGASAENLLLIFNMWKSALNRMFADANNWNFSVLSATAEIVEIQMQNSKNGSASVLVVHMNKKK